MVQESGYGLEVFENRMDRDIFQELAEIFN